MITTQHKFRAEKIKKTPSKMSAISNITYLYMFSCSLMADSNKLKPLCLSYPEVPSNNTFTRQSTFKLLQLHRMFINTHWSWIYDLNPIPDLNIQGNRKENSDERKNEVLLLHMFKNFRQKRKVQFGVIRMQKTTFKSDKWLLRCAALNTAK